MTAYTPQGCSYSYAPPSTLGFTSFALDDEGAVSATNGVPQRVRLGLGGGVTKGQPGYADPTTTAAFTWETTESNHAAKVKLGTSASSMTTTQSGYTWTTPMSLGPAVNMHEVHVCGLTAGTTYFYQVGGGPSGSEVWSATQSFTTVAASGTLTIGVLSDARDTVSTWQLVHERMKAAAVDFQLIPGDIVDFGANESLYQQWLSDIWKDPNNTGQFLTLGQQLIIPIDGNHENDTPDSFANWAIPGVAGDPYAETYASFDAGSVHFILIDDLHISNIGGGMTDTEGSAQLAWIAKDLAAADADRKNHPFIVALSHRGMFSTSNHAGDGDVLNTRAQLAPLYDKYKVDLAFNGHDHEYERSNPVQLNASGEPVVQQPPAFGTQYIINAGAGADPYAVGITNPPPAFSSGVHTAFCTSLSATGCTSKYIGVYAIVTASMTSLKVVAYGLQPSGNDPMIDTLTLAPQSQ